ncbi:MAG TPA: transglutaminase-like domain-containing protein [Candidatus Nanoarchaeia archaeon]|nr:transglutaminase-like domain-containing protein [Candidatus Nanoarchaeia archaeon]
MTSDLKYYSLPGELTDLKDFQEFTDWLSPEPRVIFQVAQGLIIHDMWIKRYGFKSKRIQKSAKCSPGAKDILAQASKLKSMSLALPRSPDERVIGCCREFSLLATALFRAKGRPARARCGFALYLAYPGFCEDHWVCEYWDGKNWIAIDPQIDPFQQSSFQHYANTQKIDPEYKKMLLTLNPLNVSSKHFIDAGTAWKMYREGKADPDKFGIGANPKDFGLKTLYGSWFMRGQLLRDFAALNKVETVPFLVRLEMKLDWTPWRLVAASDDQLTNNDFKLLDTIADLCTKPDGRLTRINKIFQSNPDLYPLL